MDNATFEEISRSTLRNIAAPIPPALISHKSIKGNKISYISWYDACDLMDERAPGWSYEVKEVGTVADKVYVIARVEVPIDDDRYIFREATGNEDDVVGGYGDSFSNAESMALRRAFAKFGLARELYQGAGTEVRRRVIAQEDQRHPKDRKGWKKPKDEAELVERMNEQWPPEQDPLPNEEEHWGDKIRAFGPDTDMDALNELVAMVTEIDAEDNPYRRHAALKLWADQVASLCVIEQIAKAGKLVKAWPQDRPSRASVLKTLTDAYNALAQ